MDGIDIAYGRGHRMTVEVGGRDGDVAYHLQHHYLEPYMFSELTLELD